MDCKSMVESVMALATAAGSEHTGTATDLVIGLVEMWAEFRDAKRALEEMEEEEGCKRQRSESEEIEGGQIQDDDETQCGLWE